MELFYTCDNSVSSYVSLTSLWQGVSKLCLTIVDSEDKAYIIHCNYSIMTTGILSMTHIENGRCITAG